MQISPRFGAAFAIPFEIAVFIVLGLVGGMWADRRFHSSPWGLLVGVTLGLAGALRAVMKVVRAAERADAADSTLKPPPAEPTDPSRAPGARASRHDDDAT